MDTPLQVDPDIVSKAEEPIGVAAADDRVASPADTNGQKKKQPAQKLFKGNPRTRSLMGVRTVGIGSYVPERIVTNADLEQQYGFEQGWIEKRTGILERRYAGSDQATSDLCVEAARKAIAASRVNPSDIDMVLVGTFTPDFTCPSTACLVQDKLGLNASAVDLQAACSGFMYALATGAQYIATGNSDLALVIGADVNSRIVRPDDQRTAPLFGDAAGAVLLARGESHQGLVCYQLGADGSGGPLLDRPSGGTSRPLTAADVADGMHYLKMDGRNVFKWAVQCLAETIELILDKAQLGPHDISLYCLHQANIRIINHAMEHLGIPPEKVFNNLDRYGNTSGASIPLALDEAFQDGLINRGDAIMLSGFGAGLTWGTGILRW